MTPTLGPDATALGQIFYYVLEGPPETNLAELRTLQDYFVGYELQSVQVVSEADSVGGNVQQYKMEVNPDALRLHGLPPKRLIVVVKDSNIDVGAKTVESGGMEYIIRGRGFIGQNKDTTQSLADIEKTVVLSRDGVPVRIRDRTQVQLGADLRGGAIDLRRYCNDPRSVSPIINGSTANAAVRQWFGIIWTLKNPPLEQLFSRALTGRCVLQSLT